MSLRKGVPGALERLGRWRRGLIYDSGLMGEGIGLGEGVECQGLSSLSEL